MSKKGVSAEEKRDRMLQLFYERGECFQLKELEKLAPKAKGIVANSVKIVLEQLVEDGLVDTDKIGTSVYFWAFPSKGVTARKKQLEDLKQEHEKLVQKLKVVDEALEASKGEEDNEEKCKKVLEEISDKELELRSLQKDLKDHEENDPEKFEEMIKKTAELKDAANRWTDNIFAIKSWCKKKFMLEDSVLNKQFGLPEDFDYVE
ncbi:meiotic nuclear division protein 1 homolog [Diabrotica virgifera virgifera]|uniref:Meiotic nuclear division protein 1 homolog n=1 Tax=Diabrotica virgifera virgifera TaxID=50390 RepID=A0A6P7F5Z8_DIAVI|nr:meiotic nuclear division protein 1 homolog [Diabrotica virgifera virgifera]